LKEVDWSLDDAKNKGRERMNDLPLGRADSNVALNVWRKRDDSNGPNGLEKKRSKQRESRVVEREEEGEQGLKGEKVE
jgi:hypothetical protein